MHYSDIKWRNVMFVMNSLKKTQQKSLKVENRKYLYKCPILFNRALIAWNCCTLTKYVHDINDINNPSQKIKQ